MREGTFDTYLTLPDESEMDIRVKWSGYYERGKTWGPMEDCYPSSGEMNIDEVVEVGQWSEGLSDAEFQKCVTDAHDRLIDHAWEEYHEVS